MELTEAARAYFKHYSMTQGRAYWSISLKKLGCSGYQYDMAWQDHPVGISIDMGGWWICLDPVWEEVLRALRIDVSVDALGQKKVVFSNPKTYASCGCGDSFMIEGVA